MYSNASFIRELSPLLVNADNPTDLIIHRYIRKAESGKIDIWLGSKYAIPLTPKVFLDGTISVISGSATVIGITTTFTDDLQINDTVQIASTKEVLRVLSISSNTEFEATSDAITTKSGSSFWIIPDEIVTCSEFITAWMLIEFYNYIEQAGNQEEVNKYADRMLLVAGNIIKQLEDGSYLNTDLTAAPEASAAARLPSYNDTSDLRELIENNDTLFINSEFLH